MKNSIIQVYPNSQEAEMMVLGCAIGNSSNVRYITETLNPTDFYFSHNKTIFTTIKFLSFSSKAVDIHIIAEELKRTDKLEDVGGVGYLASLIQYAGTSAHIEEYCKIISNKSYNRHAAQLYLAAYDEYMKDPENPVDLSIDFQRKITDLGSRFHNSEKLHIGEILSGSGVETMNCSILETLKKRRDHYSSTGEPFSTGIPTGFIDLDNSVNILEKSNLIIIAGRPAMGKTAFALNLASNICIDQQLPIGFISLEMSGEQLAERLLSLRSEVCGSKLKRGDFTKPEYEKLETAEKDLKSANLFIIDQNVSTVNQIVTKSRQLKEENNIQVLIIDYLQLLGTSGKNDSRQYEVAEVSRTLKLLAMELHIPVICIAQLSRKVEERHSKKPLLSDLRDSGQIEQDADVIVFLYRSSYYDPEDNPGQIEVLIEKNRHGPTVRKKLSFKENCGHFGNLIQKFNNGF